MRRHLGVYNLARGCLPAEAWKLLEQVKDESNRDVINWLLFLPQEWKLIITVNYESRFTVFSSPLNVRIRSSP